MMVCHAEEPAADSLAEKTVQYSITEQSSIQGVYEMFQNSRYINFISKFTGRSIKQVNRIVRTAINLFCFSIRNNVVYTYNFNYISSDVDGNPITLSAKLYIPEEAVSKDYKMKGLILSNRATLTKLGEEPTESEQFESIMAWKGYAVVMPDDCGFGVDAVHPQAFLNTQLIGKNHIDGLLAAQQIIKDMNLGCTDVLVNSGYSQGGTFAIASQKYVCDHPESGIVFTKTLAGGGAYDFGLCYDSFITDDYPEATRFTILSIVSIIESEHLGLDYSHIFKEPILSNYQEFILSKKYDVFEIMDLIGYDTPITEILDEGIINNSSYEANVLKQAMVAHNLTGGMVIPDETELFLFHSTSDNYVPFENFNKLKESISGQNIHYYFDDYGKHFNGALKFGKIIMKALNS